MRLIRKFTALKFWHVIIFGGIVLSASIILIMIIGFVLGLLTNYGRVFAFSISTFIALIYCFSILFYMPLKILLRLQCIRNNIVKINF
jgi:hypothetical protein